jgi:hypothetical protein
MLSFKFKYWFFIEHTNLLSNNHSYGAIYFLEKFNYDINFDYLSSNPFSNKLLIKYPDKINYKLLFCKNISHFFYNIHSDFIDWYWISSNNSFRCIKFININNLYLINIDKLSENNNIFVINFLIKYNIINWILFSSNQNIKAIKLLYNNFDKINWWYFSSNPKAIHILLKFKNYINWSGLSKNHSIYAIKLLYNNIDKIDWFWLSTNKSNKINYLFKNNYNKLNIHNLHLNPNIFIFNKNKYKIYKKIN